MAHELERRGDGSTSPSPWGTATRGAALTRILALRGSPGWIAGGPGVREWRYDGVLERDGIVSLVGPHVRGRLPRRRRSPSRIGEALPLLARLVRALVQLSESRAGWFPVQSDSVIFTDDGSVLFLPPSLTASCGTCAPSRTIVKPSNA